MLGRKAIGKKTSGGCGGLRNPKYTKVSEHFFGNLLQDWKTHFDIYISSFNVLKDAYQSWYALEKFLYHHLITCTKHNATLRIIKLVILLLKNVTS